MRDTYEVKEMVKGILALIVLSILFAIFGDMGEGWGDD